MKKALALVLAAAFCAACFVLTAGAATGSLSFLPNDKSNNTATGCEYKINDDGSVTVTLTATEAKLEVVFNDGSALLDNTIDMQNDGKYVAVSYVATGNAAIGFGTITNYTRPDKAADGKLADLYYNSMINDSAYAQYQGNVVEGRCFTWDLGSYLSSKLQDGDPDTEIIKTTFIFTGAVGDTITLYKYGIYADVPEDLGKEDEGSTD